MNSNIDSLKIAVFSDIHLGNKRNPTTNIIHALRTEIIHNPEAIAWNIIFLAGDVFDTLLELKSDEVGEIEMFVSDLLKFCCQHKIKLRVLEGTPSHDWKQSQVFVRMQRITQSQVDLNYIENISIEHIDDLNIDVLYVPDEAHPTTEETYSAVMELMKLKGLTKVDYAIMHGQFEFQLPSHIQNMPRHDSQKYLDIVKHYIFIGHIHTHSLYDRIMAQGSFDRLTHGQEEPKGYAVSIVSEQEQNVFFVENKLARKYLSLACYELDLKSTIEYVKKKCSKLPANACVRIEAEPKHPIFANMSELIKMYPTLTWSKLAKDREEKKEMKQHVEEVVYTPITITKDNIVSLMRTRLEPIMKDPRLFTRSIQLMEEFT